MFIEIPTNKTKAEFKQNPLTSINHFVYFFNETISCFVYIFKSKFPLIIFIFKVIIYSSVKEIKFGATHVKHREKCSYLQVF